MRLRKNLTTMQRRIKGQNWLRKKRKLKMTKSSSDELKAKIDDYDSGVDRSL